MIRPSARALIATLTVTAALMAPPGRAQEAQSQGAAQGDGVQAPAGPVIEVPGEVSRARVETPTGQPISDERVKVRVPKADPAVEYEFTSRGGTTRAARMLNERYTRDAQPAVPGVPAEKVAGGPIDLVMTWDPGFLPFRLEFSELATGSAITTVVHRARGGALVGGQLRPPEAAVDVDQRVRPGDQIVITAPATVAGTFTVRDVAVGGFTPAETLPVADAAGVDYEIRRVGDLKALWDAGPTFARVSQGTGLPLVYVWPDPVTTDSPVYVEKRFSATGRPYQLELAVTLHNVGAVDLRHRFGLRVTGWQHPSIGPGGLFEIPLHTLAGSCWTGGDLERHEFGSLAEEPRSFSTDTSWVGVDSRYFVSAVAGLDLPDGQCALEANAQTRVVSATLWLRGVQTIKGAPTACIPSWMAQRQPDRVTCEAAAQALGHQPTDAMRDIRASWQTRRPGLEGAAQKALDDAWQALSARSRDAYRFLIYTGPKDLDVLSLAGQNLSESLDFGVLGVIGEPMHRLMRWFHDLTGHWALAIILLTLLVKLLLLPLTNKSFQMMQKMQKLKPEMDALRAKHGEDRVKIQQEMMALYKRYQVNPLSGCLPMVIQMPIWLALYHTIGSAVELYHAPLGLWIQDLSAPDPYYTMPVVLGALMLVQSHFTTTTPMEGFQGKFLKYGMPAMFSIFMLFLPSGLVLYILVNTLLTIIQNIIIRRRMA